MNPLVQLNAINISTALNATLTRQNKKQASKALLGILRATVCTHQGQIAQQFLLGNEYHKQLRMATERGDKTAVSDALRKLNRLHLDALSDAWKDSVNHLTQYFLSTHRAPVSPRFCIKVSTLPNSPTPTEHHIVDLLREDGNRSNKRFPISENTGFADVAEKGRFYLENDIPEAVKLRQYKNSRLNPRISAAYKAPTRFSPRYYRGDDTDWMKCWDVGEASSPPVRNCYKSTLIIPMTLRGNVLSEEFLEDTPVGKASKVDRSIYGFLCFDHPTREYFNESDINIGYIFADLLSIYRVTSDALISKSVLYGGAAKNFL